MDIADTEIITKAQHFGMSITKSHSFLQANPATSRESLQDKALLHCLERSLDMAKGAVSTAIACTPISLATLSRTMLEELITARWLCLNRNNAIIYGEASSASMLKLIRENLKSGYGKTLHKLSGDDHTQATLDAISKKGVKITIEDRARESELHRLYSIFYRFLSTLAHSTNFQHSLFPQQARDAVKLFFPAAIALHESTYDIVATYLIDQRMISPSDIETKLGLRLNKP